MAVESKELIIAIEKPSAWGRELTITVPADQVERERAATVSRLAGKIRLPGFRKGRVPAGVIQKRYGAAIEQELLERVIGEAYREALKRENLQPITQANVDRVDYQAGADLTFKVAIEVRPEIELERIGGFRVEREVTPVAEDQVAAVLERLRDQQAAWRPIEGEAVTTGDMVVVDITPRGDDEAEPGKPRTYRLILGEGQALPAIEETILTLKPGEEGDFTVDLPEQADDPSSPPRPHHLHISLSEAKRPERPELDDEFARSLGEFDSLDALRGKVQADLEQEAEREADRTVRAALLQQIVEANPFEVPTSMVEDYLARIVPEQEGDDPAGVAEIRQSARPAAANAIRRMLVIEKVAETESLHATPDEVSGRIAEIAQKLGRTPLDVRARFAKGGRIEEIENEITERKVFDYLMSLSTIE